MDARRTVVAAASAAGLVAMLGISSVPASAVKAPSVVVRCVGVVAGSATVQVEPPRKGVAVSLRATARGAAKKGKTDVAGRAQIAGAFGTPVYAAVGSGKARVLRPSACAVSVKAIGPNAFAPAVGAVKGRAPLTLGFGIGDLVVPGGALPSGVAVQVARGEKSIAAPDGSQGRAISGPVVIETAGGVVPVVPLLISVVAPVPQPSPAEVAVVVLFRPAGLTTVQVLRGVQRGLVVTVDLPGPGTIEVLLPSSVVLPVDHPLTTGVNVVEPDVTGAAVVAPGSGGVVSTVPTGGGAGVTATVPAGAPGAAVGGIVINGFPKTLRYGNVQFVVNTVTVAGGTLTAMISATNNNERDMFSQTVFYSPDGASTTAAAGGLMKGNGLTTELKAEYKLPSAPGASPGLIFGSPGFERLFMPFNGPVANPGGSKPVTISAAGDVSANICDEKGRVEVVSADLGYDSAWGYINSGLPSPDTHHAKAGNRILHVRLRLTANQARYTCGGLNMSGDLLRVVGGGQSYGPAGGALKNALVNAGSSFEGDFGFQIPATLKSFELELGIFGKSTIQRFPVTLP